MRLINLTTSEILAEKVLIADSFFLRLKGLLGLSKMPLDTALLINPCKQVHMFFMKFPIVAVFVDRHGNVLHIQNLNPWKVSNLVVEAEMVFEMAFDKAEKIKVGQYLMLKK